MSHNIAPEPDPLQAANDDGEGVTEPDSGIDVPGDIEASDAHAVAAGHGHETDAPTLGNASIGAPAVPGPAAELAVVGTPDGTSRTGMSTSLGVVQVTQVRRPWRATARTVFQAAVALATLLPFIATGVYGNGHDAPAAVAQVLAVAAAVTRVMALPQVEDFIQRFVPFLAAAPTTKEGSTP